MNQGQGHALSNAVSEIWQSIMDGKFNDEIQRESIPSTGGIKLFLACPHFSLQTGDRG